MAFLPRPVTRVMLSTPEARASSTPYWMIGLSTSGSISFGWALVAGRNRVPSPAAGKTAFRIGLRIARDRISETGGPGIRFDMLDPAFLRDHPDDVRKGLRHRGIDPAAVL